MKKLTVKAVTKSELEEHWKTPLLGNILKCNTHKLFVRCNSEGKVAWDIAPVYNHIELIKRDNVTIINK